jgi:hypothetical protein
MAGFHSAKDAKQFLVAIITNEAERENVPLSDVERKMLYFSETGWTLPDIMDVADEFESTYDDKSYEMKIAHLIRSAGKRLQRDSREEYEKMWSAIRFLKRQDHYISVMTQMAGLRAPGDLLRLWGTGFVIVLLLSCLGFVWFSLSDKYHLEKYVPTGETAGFLVWAIVACSAVAYVILRGFLGTQKTNDKVASLIERFFGRSGRDQQE